MVMAFFGSAFLVLLVLTNGAYGVLRKPAGAGHQPSLSLGALAMRGATRRTWRSLGVVAALACGSFLVIAVGGMREDLRGQAGESWSGTGGFGFVAETTVGLTPQDVGELALRAMGGRAVGLRLRDGDDAGCLNLNRAREPRLLGVDPAAMRRRHAFCPAAEEGGCLWDLLDLDGRGDWVPALVGDHDTAAWGLEATLGLEEGQILTYRGERGETFRIKLVGSLPMRISVFQGSVLIPESAFVEHFPSETGHRVLLLDSASTNQHEMIAGLTRRFERQGLDVEPAVDRLMTFYQVEMTYLAMFLVLGGLELAFGDFRLGRPVTMFVSFVFYGGALILAPLLIKRARAAAAAEPAKP